MKARVLLEKQCPAEISKFRLAYFHVISSNATIYTAKLDKKILLSKTKAVVWR